MVRLFIESVDRSASVESVSIDEALTSQPDTLRFRCNNYAPTTGQEVAAYDATFLTDTITAGSLVVVRVDNTRSDLGGFTAGTDVQLGIGTANEETVSITAVTATSITLASVANSHAAGEWIGTTIFGGVILSVQSVEVEKNTDYVLWDVNAADYASVMDRRLINNVWLDTPPHKIAYDILNTVNYSSALDAFEYVNNAAIQAAWTVTNDANAPTTSSTANKVGTYKGVFSWTYSGGLAPFTGALTSADISGIVGAASGQPTAGTLSFWMKISNVAAVTSIRLFLGSDSSHVAYADIPTSFFSTEWTFVTMDFSSFGLVGTPDWTACDWARFTVTETASASLSIDDFRINGAAMYTPVNIDTSGSSLAKFTASFQSARDALTQLAEHAGKWEWYVDYSRDLHFFPPNTAAAAPFTLTESSENHWEFSAQPDLSQLRNRVYVRGGSEKSATQTEEQYGDGIKTTFFTRESPRSIGPYLYDLTLYVDTGGGYVAKTYGIANKDDAASFDFLVNPEEKYITNGTHAVLGATHKLKAVYTYPKPILVKQDNVSSQAAMKALQPGTDGIYEHVIIDKSIESSEAARAYARAELAQFANALITVTFKTNHDGLHAGQLLTITKPSHGVNGDYLIQRISHTQVGPDAWERSVTCASTLFGMTELLKFLLRDRLDEDAGASVDLLDTPTETITFGDSASTSKTSTKFRWKAATPSSEGTVWNRFSWA